MSDLITCGSLRGFKAGDIITCDNDGTFWSGQRVEVLGYDKGGNLWGSVNSQESFTDSFEGLILLERPDLDFKVGEKVLFFYGAERGGLEEQKKGIKGRVAVINPANVLEPYLVEYKADSGLSLIPWVPKRLKGSLLRRRWCGANQLKSLKSISK